MLLNRYETDEPDELSIAKVADFGTVRADNRGDRASNLSVVLSTTNAENDQKTHASTQNIVGTSPYIPNEVRAGVICTSIST